MGYPAPSPGSPGSSRRAFLRGPRPVPEAPRPPWTDQGRVAEACTRCDACIKACPEGVLTRGDGGFPAFDPRAGRHGEGCTFCGACAEACPEPVFSATDRPPWDLTAAVSDGCLAEQGVACQSCGDACMPRALRFPPRLGAPPKPVLDTAACTGCGACVPRCPSRAITLTQFAHTEGIAANG